MTTHPITRNGSAAAQASGAPKQPHLRVIPLGGLHEIGKNTCVFEYSDDIMLVDAGLAFASRFILAIGQ